MPTPEWIIGVIRRAVSDYAAATGQFVEPDVAQTLADSARDRLSDLSGTAADEARLYDATRSVLDLASTREARARYEDAQRRFGHTGIRYLQTPPELENYLAAQGPIRIDGKALMELKLPWPWGTD